jgi:hypothetical protein
VYPAQENLQNSKFAEKGFLGSCFFQLWDLGRVVGTDLKNLIVKLANKSIASGRKALKLTLELLSRYFKFRKTAQAYFLPHKGRWSFQVLIN